jgi:hypothetical protein
MNTTKVITIAAVMVVLLVVWPRTAEAGTSFSIGVRIGSGSLHIGQHERDYILPGGCHTPTLHRRISHHEYGHRNRYFRKHHGGYYQTGANYYRISDYHSPVIVEKRVSYGYRGSHRNYGGTSHVRGRH